MARKAAAASKDTRAARKRSTRKRSAAGTGADDTSASKPSAATPTSVPDFGDLSRLAKLMTPAQAIELYRANAALALEAMAKSMHYWSEMFDLIVEMQKRLFALLEEQMPGVPGVRETKAAMAMLPDLSQMRNVVSAMQGVVKSGGSTFESMQRVMGDIAKIAQGATGADRR